MAKFVTGDALAARRARQLATSRMPKCSCGAVVRLGEATCGRCAPDPSKPPATMTAEIVIAAAIELADPTSAIEMLSAWQVGDWEAVSMYLGGE